MTPDTNTEKKITAAQLQESSKKASLAQRIRQAIKQNPQLERAYGRSVDQFNSAAEIDFLLAVDSRELYGQEEADDGEL